MMSLHPRNALSHGVTLGALIGFLASFAYMGLLNILYIAWSIALHREAIRHISEVQFLTMSVVAAGTTFGAIIGMLPSTILGGMVGALIARLIGLVGPRSALGALAIGLASTLVTGLALNGLVLLMLPGPTIEARIQATTTSFPDEAMGSYPFYLVGLGIPSIVYFLCGGLAGILIHRRVGHFGDEDAGASA